MELKYAQELAEKVVAALKPCCERIEIAGSIRRRKPLDIHDVDLVCIPSNQGQFITAAQGIGQLSPKGALQIKLGTNPVDLYIATPATWATLLLIRTGSKEHNIKLCKLARAKGMTLKADGSGLFKIAPKQTEYEVLEDERIAGDTEASIFEALGLPYVEPWKRN